MALWNTAPSMHRSPTLSSFGVPSVCEQRLPRHSGARCSGGHGHLAHGPPVHHDAAELVVRRLVEPAVDVPAVPAERLGSAGCGEVRAGLVMVGHRYIIGYQLVPGMHPFSTTTRARARRGDRATSGGGLACERS